MSKTTCAISGIQFETEHLNGLYISHTEGYFHPIFAAPTSALSKLYVSHCMGKLSLTDSYLLFLATLHSSNQITWEHPVTLDPTGATTQQLIENNFRQLVTVLEKTRTISTSNFIQPDFIVAFDNSHLLQVANWIKAWEDNLDEFVNERADTRQRDSIAKIEADLSYQILSNNDPATFADIVANWADKASGGFPVSKSLLYHKTIKSCFDSVKMFTTPLALLKEIKDYCECNIEAGSIHFHTLMKVINSGISKHIDYLGGSSLALGYTLLPVLPDSVGKPRVLTTGDKTILSITSNATPDEPIARNYTSSITFLKAKLAYKVAMQAKKAKEKESIKASIKTTVPNPLGDL